MQPLNKKGKYLPLQNWFANQSSDKQELELSFTRIEELIGNSLPPSAREYEAWWLDKSENTTHSHARSWLETGWQVGKLDLAAKKVSFKRV